MSEALQTKPVQPLLVGAEEWPWPERPEIVEAFAKPRAPHTGKIVSKDALLCRSVALDLLAMRAGSRISKRQIAARYQIGRETIDAIERVMDERGELRPLQEAISAGLGDCIMLMLQRLRDSLLRGEYSAAQIPIAMSALIDKKAQLDAGLVPGTGLVADEVEESRVAVAFRAIQAARRKAAESESTGSGAQVLDVTALPVAAVGSDTPAHTPDGPDLAPTAPPVDATAPGPDHDRTRTQGQDRGEGVGLSDSGAQGRGVGSENFST